MFEKDLISSVISNQTSDVFHLCLFQHMRHYRMIRGGGNMTSLVMAHHQGMNIEEEEVATTTSGSTTSHLTLTLMTSSKTLTLLLSINTSTTLTPMPMPTKRDTLIVISRLTRRRWTGRGNIFSTGASVGDSLMMCLRTWKRCSPLTHTVPGLKAASTAQQNSTAGQWPSVEGTWWPPSLTAPERSRRVCPWDTT